MHAANAVRALANIAVMSPPIPSNAQFARFRPGGQAAPASGARSSSGKAVLCPMPGLIGSIAVAVERKIKAGETLARSRQ